MYLQFEWQTGLNAHLELISEEEIAKIFGVWSLRQF